MILSPLVRDRKGEHQAIFQDLQKAGFVRARVDRRIYDLSEEFWLDKNQKHTIEAVVDRLQIEKNGNAARLADSIETALKLGSGVVGDTVDTMKDTAGPALNIMLKLMSVISLLLAPVLMHFGGLI